MGLLKKVNGLIGLASHPGFGFLYRGWQRAESGVMAIDSYGFERGKREGVKGKRVIPDFFGITLFKAEQAVIKRL